MKCRELATRLSAGKEGFIHLWNDIVLAVNFSDSAIAVVQSHHVDKKWWPEHLVDGTDYSICIVHKRDNKWYR